MLKFKTKVLTFILLLLTVVIGYCSLADGNTDPFYLRFTTKKQKNLILGTSRAAQGLQPQVFKSVLKTNLFNYAFTETQSPYGKIYYQSIIKKHSKEKGGIAVLTIDPWSVSSNCSNPNDSTLFRENNLCLHNTPFVNLNPNIFYLFNNLKGNYINIIKPPTNKMYLHKNGWLEINNVPMDNLSNLNRINRKIKTCKEIMLPSTKFSSFRFNYLLKTINYLKKYGKVYLVRLPIHAKMMEIENKLSPNFYNKIKPAIDQADGYLDLTIYNKKFKYTDGNHLYKTSGAEVSTIIANWIKNKKINDLK